MCGKLDCYRNAFSSFFSLSKNDQDQSRRGAYTPHLLLSTLDLIATRQIGRNFIELSPLLAETFKTYLEATGQTHDSISMAQPFYSLDGASFWHLALRNGQTKVANSSIQTREDLRKICHGARFDQELFPLLVMETSRKKLRKVLITSFFPPDTQERILSLGK